ncbi:MAG TPA: hypothetical protein VF627_03450 [Abditibacterium sp.]
MAPPIPGSAAPILGAGAGKIFNGARNHSMTQDDMQQGTRFDKTIAFAAANPTYFPAGKPAGGYIASLQTVSGVLSKHAADQIFSDGLAKSSVAQKRAVLMSIWDDMVAIARVARAHQSEVAGLSDVFKSPKNGREDDWIAAASAMLLALDADPTLAQFFIDNGMPDDFVADLRADIAAFTTISTAQDQNDGNYRAATLEIDAAIKDGIALMIKLDAYCKAKFAGNPVLLAAWNSASHLELRRVHRKVAPDKK